MNDSTIEEYIKAIRTKTRDELGTKTLLVRGRYVPLKDQKKDDFSVDRVHLFLLTYFFKIKDDEISSYYLSIFKYEEVYAYV